MRRLDECSLPSILRSKLLTALLNNDISGKVNARGLRESFGQIWRDADVFRVSGSAERRPCLAKFYCDDIALRQDACVFGAENWSQQSPVSDDEQVIKRFDGPAQACIRAHILRFGVVLNETAQHEIGAAGVGTLQLPQTLDEVALGNVPEIIFDVGFKLHSAFSRCPLQIVLPLS